MSEVRRGGGHCVHIQRDADRFPRLLLREHQSIVEDIGMNVRNNGATCVHWPVKSAHESIAMFVRDVLDIW
jgi:hypothetical protein